MNHRPELTTRQAQIVERVAKGLPDKRIAAELSISIDTVRHHIQEAALRIPGEGRPRHRLTLFFHAIEDTIRASRGEVG